MSDIVKVACVQLNCGPEIEPNLKAAETFIREAAAQGATFIATPENTARIRAPENRPISSSMKQKDHPGVPFFGKLAAELKIWLLVGSMGVKITENKLVNRSFLFSDTGELAFTYDKIHLFDVDLPTGEKHRESDRIKSGVKAVVARTPFAKIGLTVCYDIRFPYLYRALAKAGAQILTVPAAFTVPTGQAHWEVLLRARAIETGSFVVAPAQTGEHQGGRRTWGHSMIISPWGEVLADGGTEPGIIIRDLNLEDVRKARAAIPALKHDRDYSVDA